MSRPEPSKVDETHTASSRRAVPSTVKTLENAPAPAAGKPPKARSSTPTIVADHVPDSDEQLAPLLAVFRRRRPKAPTARIIQAYELAAAAHAQQTRKSGEPYISHPVAVATILAELALDEVTILGALLHDVVEDTGITLETIERRFGSDVALIVDGVTKLDRIEFDSKEAQQAATMRKMLVAMARDLRVLLIKLADRLHNMRTIDALPEHKQRRIAQETLDIYAPLAHRLGISEVKLQLEDLAFETIEPRKFAEIKAMVASRAPERDRFIELAIAEMRQKLSELRIEADVTGRPKHYWSIYEKMVLKGKEFDEIHDLVGLRVIVDSIKDCYAALGCIHATWKPVQGRFKDYIAMAKFNLYQSLHTTVVGPEGKVLECQIRTKEMHHIAEYGIAAHWAYKERGIGSERVNPTEAAWLQRLAERSESNDGEDDGDPGEFLETLKVDLEQDEVFLFTPKGKVIPLPVGATPIDFAYAVHTDVGHRCIGAKVNGRLVPLDTTLSSGETVEIMTSKSETAQPTRDWLKIVVTPRARSKIRLWFSKERREDAIESGREDLVKAMRKEGLPVQKLSGSPVLRSVADQLGYHELDALLVAIGEGHVSALNVAQRLAKELHGGDHEEQMPTTLRSRPNRANRRAQARDGVGVHVEGLDDMMVRLARCCTPVPGDEIVGFVTRGRGVSVHRSDCANSRALRAGEGSRTIDVEWDEGARDQGRRGTYVVSVMVEALDRHGLLADVARVLADNRVNVLATSTTVDGDRVAHERFDFELADPSHLDAILSAVRRVDSVFDAYRVLPGRKGG